MDQPLGDVLRQKEVPYPPRTPLHGAYTSLVPLEQSHAECLFKHLAGPGRESIWTYLPYDCAPTLAEFESLVANLLSSSDLMFFAVLSGPLPESSAAAAAAAAAAAVEPVGIMAYINIVPEHRRVEIGWLVLGDALKRTRKATEAFYLLLRRAFVELGYERVEWKANALNAASRGAAERLGFLFEGIFRKHWVAKGRRRDTVYLAMIDDDWPAVEFGLEEWLDGGNFDESGQQKRGLKECRESFSPLGTVQSRPLGVN